ncbi:MAG: SUMF1/EgtB/PvdO family nonheme iron enzyme [Chloroflexota bacterium]
MENRRLSAKPSLHVVSPLVSPLGHTHQKHRNAHEHKGETGAKEREPLRKGAGAPVPPLREIFQGKTAVSPPTYAILFAILFTRVIPACARIHFFLMQLNNQQRTKFRQILVKHFSFEELKTLAFNIGVNYQHLPHTTQNEFARELFTHCEQHGKLTQLIKQILQQRSTNQPYQVVHKSTLARYRQYLLQRYRYLDFKGMGITDRVPLELPLVDMYVPLRARIEMPDGETWSRELRLAGRLMSDDEAEAIGHRLSEPQPVLEQLQKAAGLIILGDPGAGKTTFLKYLALRLAQGDDIGLGQRLPILLPLSAYANALANEDISLDDFIPRYYRDLGIKLPLDDMLDAALQQGQALLLLDGLDEVKELSQRTLVVDRVMTFFAFHQAQGNKFVLTSRIVGYRDVRPTQQSGLRECTLVDFDEVEIEDFVARWTTAVERAIQGHDATADAASEKQELLDAIAHNPGVKRLAANPLLLTILALMKRQGVTLPERRVQLYEQYIKTLIKHWNLARSLTRRTVRPLDDLETVRVLAPLALWMHETSPGVGLVKQADVSRKLVEIYEQRGHEQPEKAAQQLLADAREYAGLLVERGQRTYGFIHLTFQEYLAAVAIAQQSQQDVGIAVDMLGSRLGDDNWHEVSLLAVGYIGIIQQLDLVASKLLLELIKAAPGEPGEAINLAGEAVVDVWPGGVTKACKDEVIQTLLKAMRADGISHDTDLPSLGDLASLSTPSTIPSTRRARAAQLLAQLGDPRPEVMTTAAMQFCAVPAGDFYFGEDNVLTPLPYDFWMSRYPVTQAQFAEFVSAGGYSEARYWEEAIADGRWENGKIRDWQGERTQPMLYRHPFHLPNHPAVGITWYEAAAFTRWLAKRHKAPFRLPTEQEWEKAGRGGLQLPTATIRSLSNLTPFPQLALGQNSIPQRIYPMGDRLTPNEANYRETEIEATSGMGCFPSGTAPYGNEEMSGNVWEWTSSWYEQDKIGRVLRGGSWNHYHGYARVSIRDFDYPDNALNFIGFRIVAPVVLASGF